MKRGGRCDNHYGGCLFPSGQTSCQVHYCYKCQRRINPESVPVCGLNAEDAGRLVCGHIHTYTPGSAAAAGQSPVMPVGCLHNLLIFSASSLTCQPACVNLYHVLCNPCPLPYCPSVLPILRLLLLSILSITQCGRALPSTHRKGLHNTQMVLHRCTWSYTGVSFFFFLINIILEFKWTSNQPSSPIAVCSVLIKPI